ncbi:MAG: sensor histidine kinase [Peptococcaceae bacterium]|jgi:two-component system sensor histidine kinase YesM|nr:sensor histidine kinase [Peptococcaceae bacterium]
MRKKLWPFRGIRYWLRHFDANAYAGQRRLPEGVHPEVAELARRVSEATGARYTADMLNKQMEYTMLQSQINPHFLYNTLEAIRSEALLGGNRGVAEMIERLSRFFRYSISSRGDFVTLQDELVNLQDYFCIQQYRFGSRFTLEVRQENEALLRCHMPKMTLQPIVENAIYHGLEQKKGPGGVALRIGCTEKKLCIWVCDDGVGIEPERARELNRRLLAPGGVPRGEEKGGIALENVCARIRLYFGDEYGVRISSIPGEGTEVEIVLPYLDELGFEGSRLPVRAGS